MSESATIDRAEIAERLGIGLIRLINIICYSDVKVPEPIGKCGQRLVYDRTVILEWIAGKPLVGMRWNQPLKKQADPVLDMGAIQSFLSGTIGTTQRQRKRNQLRRIAAKHAPRLTTRIHVDVCEHQTDPVNYWKGLI